MSAVYAKVPNSSELTYTLIKEGVLKVGPQLVFMILVNAVYIICKFLCMRFCACM